MMPGSNETNEIFECISKFLEKLACYLILSEWPSVLSVIL